ncbi:hypothetical protein P3T36_002310 [Kitasatospora sp. MAP12-15]|uniref:hypothetical protein n=1 Tax=unclassified Kitasatospora TaxID=2633591 RepID=UPI002474149D|nr:hypothetical protein [Kitasatospora sp. MAP12-44]MDH6108769.1 hypothetical protein [Kitasatospora sp. MAP12-44]
MMSIRRLALPLACATALTGALVAASPAVALQPAQLRAPACGAMDQDFNGAFAGTFDQAPGDTINVSFAAPQSAETNWTVEGWTGHGKGTFELTAGGIKWNNSDLIAGPATGVDTEQFHSTAISCDTGTSEVSTIRGEVTAPTPDGTVKYPFTVVRQS